MTKSIYEALIELSEAPSAADARDAASYAGLGATATAGAGRRISRYRSTKDPR